MRLSVPLIAALMLAGYLLVMGFLALGLLASRRGLPRRRPAGARRGWPGLLRQVAGTVTGGGLLLAAVVAAYYYGVAGLGRGFLADFATGSAALLALALPLFLAASWLTTRRPRRPRRPGGRFPGRRA